MDARSRTSLRRASLRLPLGAATALAMLPTIFAVAVLAAARPHEGMTIAGMLAGLAQGVVVALLVRMAFHRMIARRLAPLLEDARGIARGQAPPRRAVLDDEIGKLEEALAAIADFIRERDERLCRDASRQKLDAQILRAMGMADTEEDVAEVAGRALARVVPSHPAEILLSDARGAQLHLTAISATGLSPGCPVESPAGCAALRRGQTLRFADSDELDACPRLRERPDGACSALCMPLNVMGRAIGVVHVTGPRFEPPSDEALSALETVSTHIGARLALLHSLETFQAQASADAAATHAGDDRAPASFERRLHLIKSDRPRASNGD